MLNKDYREMLQCLSDEGVKFLVVGAYALAVHGYPRATKDIDFFVWANRENAAKLLRALDRFGAPLRDLSAGDFASEGTVFQIGAGPRRIDIITRIDGVEFEAAYARRLTVSLEGVDLPVISRDDLIANKRATGRTQDLADVERLTAPTRSRDDERTR
jgi:predicted nucleotidyltransferase